jgi:N-acetylmuramoyl-L-alanine amidase
LFLAGAKQQVEHALHPGDTSTLTIDFPVPVNPNVSSDGNRIQFVFRHEPIIWGADRVDYTDKLIRSLAFTENNGQSELTVSGSAPLLASFSNGGKTITITPAPAPQVAKAPESPPAPAPTTTATPETVPPTPTAEVPTVPGAASISPAPAHFYVLIDASHGGDDPGVKFSDKLTEKEISLVLAQRLRAELQDRGIPTQMVRNDDTTVPLDARAVMANEKHAGVYVSLHAGGPGSGVRVYTALMGAGATENTSPLFTPWDQAQRAYVDQSATVANALVTEFANRKINAAMMPGSIAPLATISAPAIAIEVAPPPSKDADCLRLAAYQKTIAEAAAKGIASARTKMMQGAER